MTVQFEAIFENGTFRPLKPIDLPENQRVTVTVDVAEAPEGIQVDFALPADRWEAFCEALDAPPRDLPAIRELMERRERGYADTST
jgi:predicted DNA-binding antitoxin AbrB/MazE fold protein